MYQGALFTRGGVLYFKPTFCFILFYFLCCCCMCTRDIHLSSFLLIFVFAGCSMRLHVFTSFILFLGNEVHFCLEVYFLEGNCVNNGWWERGFFLSFLAGLTVAKRL